MDVKIEEGLLYTLMSFAQLASGALSDSSDDSLPGRRLAGLSQGYPTAITGLSQGY